MEYSDLILEKAKNLKDEFEEINLLMSYNEVQADILYFKSLKNRLNEIDKIVTCYQNFLDIIIENEKLNHDLSQETDSDIISILNEEIVENKRRQNNNYLVMKYLLLGKNLSNANIEINIQDKNLLFNFCKMYILYAKQNFLKCKAEYFGDYQANIFIEGNFAYERFILESGKHLIKMNNLSNIEMQVFCYKNEKLSFDIDEKDLKIDVFRSSGAGGQNVNKVETAIRVTHLPTNITVTCQDERSQRQNKERAIENLKNKVYEFYNSKIIDEKNSAKKLAKSKNIRTYDFFNHTVTQNGKTEKLEPILNGNLNIFTDDILLREENK